MTTSLIIVFILAYTAIALEHPIKINKSASALIGAGILWSIYALSTGDNSKISHELSETLIETAQIVFFLMGAMTIVEVIDTHNGFDVVTRRIKTTNLTSLMLIVCCITFFFSAALDNLTTTIVMVSLMKKLLEKKEDRLFFVGMIVIAANSGGAWSPIGDVTTTMLWIGGQITTSTVITQVFFPSVVSLIIPLFVVYFKLKGQKVISPKNIKNVDGEGQLTTLKERNIMFFLGFATLISVPIFKTVTQLPPFMGIMFGLGILWLVGDIVHGQKSDEIRDKLNLTSSLKKIDMASIIFFIGILLAVATLEHSHILTGVASWLNETIGELAIIIFLIGIVSAIVDNVPIVAASMGMYDINQFKPDSFLWVFLAYCAGTGGSILIIGSAAGVAAMGIEKVDFIWYLKKISFLAFIGYAAGAAAYLLQYYLLIV